MTSITSIKDPRIQIYRSLREKAVGVQQHDTFIAEGEKVARKALESVLEIISIFALEEYHSAFEMLIERANIPVEARYITSRELMSQIIGFEMHQGVLVCVRRPVDAKLIELSAPIVVLSGITDSENVGVIVRNCAAFGVNSLIIDRDTSSPWLRRAVRVSMGAVFGMKVHRTYSLSETLINLKNDLNYSIISAEIHESAHDISSFIFPQKSVIIFGSEGYGIAEDILELSDHVVAIAVSSGVDSLNVGSASAVVLHGVFKKHSAR